MIIFFYSKSACDESTIYVSQENADINLSVHALKFMATLIKKIFEAIVWIIPATVLFLPFKILI